MTDLQATVERHELPLESTFQTSHGTSETATVVAVELEDADSDDDRVGIGAASPSAYYGEDAASVEAAVPELVALLASLDEPPTIARGGAESAARDDSSGPNAGTTATADAEAHSGGDATGDVTGDAAIHARTEADAPDIATIEDALAEARPTDAAARAAISIALHDLAAKRRELPLYRIWGLDPDGVPPTSYTIGIAEPNTMAERARAADERGHEHLKVKLGTDADAERLGAVREAAPEASLRVDPNCAWDRDTALERLPTLTEHGVELLEQPVPAADVDALRAVTERASMPVAADEACVDAEEVGWVADACDAIVCKVATCGGLAGARRQIAAARWHDLDVLLGCMVESNASIAASWHLAPLASYADLDGALLLDTDPFEGLPLVDGAVELADQERPGTGARRREE